MPLLTSGAAPAWGEGHGVCGHWRSSAGPSGAELQGGCGAVGVLLGERVRIVEDEVVAPPLEGIDAAPKHRPTLAKGGLVLLDEPLEFEVGVGNPLEGFARDPGVHGSAHDHATRGVW